MGSYGGYIAQTIVTLLAVCLVAFVVLYGARRLGVGRARGPIALVGLLPLDARRSIYVVKVARQVLVVGASEAGFTKLGEMSAADVPVDDERPTFGNVLTRVLARDGAERRSSGPTAASSSHASCSEEEQAS